MLRGGSFIKQTQESNKSLVTFPFDDVWKRICSVTHWKNQSDLAGFLGIKSPSVTGAKNRGTFPIEWAVKLALDYNINITWLLTGEGSKYCGKQGKKWKAPNRVYTDEEKDYSIPIPPDVMTQVRSHAESISDEIGPAGVDMKLIMRILLAIETFLLRTDRELPEREKELLVSYLYAYIAKK